MGLIERLKGGDEPGPEREDPDYWRIGFMPWNGDGGFRSLGDEWDKLAEPVDRETFEWNTGDLEGGKYRLMAINETKMRRPEDFGVKGWTMEVGEPDDSKKSGEQDQLERKVDHLLAQVQESDDDGSGILDKDPDAILKAWTLQNPELMYRYADQIIPAAWGATAPGGGIGYAEFDKNPLGALLFDAYNNPEKVRKAGENLGAGFGAGLDGFFTGMDDPAAVAADDDPEPDDVDDDEEWQPRRSSDEVNLDLTAPDEDFEDLVESFDSRQAAEESDETAGEGESPPEPPESDDGDQGGAGGPGDDDTPADAAGDREGDDAAGGDPTSIAEALE